MADGDVSFNQSNEPSEAQQWLQNFWPHVTEQIRTMNAQNDFKMQDLPLARIKKIMKLDEDVKMISQEAPVVFAKAAEIFISELTLRAWANTEENKRRTLQKNDISMAISKFDQFDFLIDIVPRDLDNIKPSKRDGQQADPVNTVQYYVSMPPSQSISGQPQTIQIGQGATQLGAQVIHIQAPQQTQQQQGAPVIQQIQLNASQLQALQQQLQGRQSGEPIIIQTANGQQQAYTLPQGQQLQFVQQQATYMQQGQEQQP